MSDEPAVDAIDQLQAILSGGRPSATVQAGITEAASENQPKRKRGRPRIHAYWGHFTDAKTDHAKANEDFACRAARHLFEHKAAHPEVFELTGLLVTKDGHAMYNPDRMKVGILAELGRLMYAYGNGDEVALQLAVELAHKQPRLNVKQAAAWIRRIRLKQEATDKDGNVVNLLEAIMRAIDGYLDSHPGTPTEVIIEAIDHAAGVYDWTPDEDD